MLCKQKFVVNIFLYTDALDSGYIAPVFYTCPFEILQLQYYVWKIIILQYFRS